MEKEQWGDNLKYPEIYPRLENFAPKELLNYEIANMIIAFQKRENLENLHIAELGAGPAPISKILTHTDPQAYECKAFDINPKMRGTEEFPFEYDSNFDLTDPCLPEEELGKYDVVVLENVLYATSMSPNGTEKYTSNESNLLKVAALKKAAAMLRPDGILILTDPLNKTEDFGIGRIIEFLNKEREAINELNRGKKNLLEVFLKNLTDKEMRKMLKINKKIMAKAVLNDEKEIANIIQYTDLFYPPIYWNPDTYLGSNLTTVLRRNDEKIKLDNCESTVLNNPLLLEGKSNPKILHWIGNFRKRIYALSNATNNLPEVDKYDKKPEGIIAVYPSKNGLGIGATATLQQRGEIGLDIEHLMKSEKGSFYNQMVKEISSKSQKVAEKIASGKEIKFAEIRRLAADSLSHSDFVKFFQSLCDIFFNYSKKNDIDIVLFVSDEKRAKAFNIANKKAEFKKIEGFQLNREDPEFQTMMVCAANYFFKDWKTLLSEDEIERINELSLLITNGDIWSDVIKDNPQKDNYENAVKKLLDTAPDNVSIYFTDYPMYD